MAPDFSPALRFSQAANQFQTTQPRFAGRDGFEPFQAQSPTGEALPGLTQTIYDFVHKLTGNGEKLQFAGRRQPGCRINHLA